MCEAPGKKINGLENPFSLTQGGEKENGLSSPFHVVCEAPGKKINGLENPYSLTQGGEKENGLSSPFHVVCGAPWMGRQYRIWNAQRRWPALIVQGQSDSEPPPPRRCMNASRNNRVPQDLRSTAHGKSPGMTLPIENA